MEEKPMEEKPMEEKNDQQRIPLPPEMGAEMEAERAKKTDEIPLDGPAVAIVWPRAQFQGQFPYNGFNYDSLRSAFRINSYDLPSRSEWEPFGYARVQPMEDGTIATKAHTNLSRSGPLGLPRDQEALLTKWRAQINVPMSDEVVEWASTTSVEFWYNMKQYANSTLLDLILGPRDMGAVWVRGCLPFSVMVNGHNERALKAMRVYLETLKPQKKTETHLQAIMRHIDAMLHGDPPSEGRALTCWIVLEGMFKKTVC
jgi:hypothetical protein